MKQKKKLNEMSINELYQKFIETKKEIPQNVLAKFINKKSLKSDIFLEGFFVSIFIVVLTIGVIMRYYCSNESVLFGANIFMMFGCIFAISFAIVLFQKLCRRYNANKEIKQYATNFAYLQLLGVEIQERLVKKFAYQATNALIDFGFDERLIGHINMDIGDDKRYNTKNLKLPSLFIEKRLISEEYGRYLVLKHITLSYIDIYSEQTIVTESGLYLVINVKEVKSFQESIIRKYYLIMD